LPRESKETYDDHDIPDGSPACAPKLAGRIFPPARKLGKRHRHLFARRQAIQTLSELDDRALRDIGIERSRIESAVRGTVDPDFGRTM